MSREVNDRNLLVANQHLVLILSHRGNRLGEGVVTQSVEQRRLTSSRGAPNQHGIALLLLFALGTTQAEQGN